MSKKTDRRKFIASSTMGISAATLSGCAAFDRTGWQQILGDAIGTGAMPPPPLKPGNEEGIDEKWFVDFIADFLKNDPSNSLGGQFADETLFKDSIVGFVKGDDPLLEEYKKIIGPFHNTPKEAMDYAASVHGISAPPLKNIGVVSFILPLAG
jgi:hypothetical protein